MSDFKLSAEVRSPAQISLNKTYN